MNLVVDANILFSSLIRDGKTIELFLNPFLKLYVPEFILQEFEGHKQEILEKTNRPKDEFNEILSLIKQVVIIVPKEDFEEYLKSSKKISPDQDDVMYFALALKLECPIWSNDKRLKEKQSVVKVYSTEDLVNMVR